MLRPMLLNRNLQALVIFLLLMTIALSQKGGQIPKCCCSSKYNHPTLKTTYDFAFHYMSSLMHMNYTAKAFYRQTSKFPQSFSKAIWKRATQLHQMNEVMNIKLKLPPPSEHDIADLKYCQGLPPKGNRRLLTTDFIEQYTTTFYPFPSPGDEFPLDYQTINEEEDKKIDYILGVLKARQSEQQEQDKSQGFLMINQKSTSYSNSDTNTLILQHLCRRGYAAYVKKQISSTKVHDPLEGDPLYIRLMSTVLGEQQVYQEIFERWMGMFIESCYGSDNFQYFTCSDVSAVCDPLC